MKNHLLLYILATSSALVLGILFPSFFLLFTPINSFILAFIFLITTLTLRRIDVVSTKEISVIALLTLWMLVGLPYVVFFITSLLLPTYTIPLVLLASMPAGMTSPLLTRITKGKESFALIVTLATSILAPLTIPFIMQSTVGSSVHVPAKDMFVSLTLVMIVPCICAWIIRRTYPKVIQHVQKIAPLSIIFLAILIASSIAPYGTFLRSSFQSTQIITPLFIVFCFFIFLHLCGLLFNHLEKKTLRSASLVSTVYMNFTLAIYIASTFFNDNSIILPVVLSVIPWVLLLPLYVVLHKK
jgi:BASS family bile acid:Na+ symporter